MVLDVKAPYRTVPVPEDCPEHAPVHGRPGSVHHSGAATLVIGQATAFGAMQRLFAGPTQAELARGLKFVSCGGDRDSRIPCSVRDGVARVQLLGKVSSGGSTFTIASKIK